jgi:signal transduction histidine kinase
MTAEPAEPDHGRRMWGSLARRADPFLDPVVALVASGMALASLLTTQADTIDPRLHEPDVFAAVATVVAAGSLAWRRKRPLASYAVFVAGALMVSGTFHYIGLLSVLMLVSLYSLATHGKRTDGLIGLGAGIVSFVGLRLAGVPDLRTKDVLLAVATLVAAWAVAEALRSRREQQRDQLRDQLRAAVTGERLRIARELHDVVAHSMSLIAVQAGVGAHVIRTNPAAAEQSLDVIADTSRRALDQTRSMLGMLRETNEDGIRPPTPWLDDLPALLDDVRAAGLEVELLGSGSVSTLDPAVSLAAYRIVQESLTNVIKHSAARGATVTVAASEDEIDVQITDRGPARLMARIPSSGHGLVGLDERARLIGGSLTYGFRGDGFCVHAVLPRRAGR